MRKQTFTKIEKLSGADLTALRAEGTEDKEKVALEKRLRLAFIVINQEYLKEREYAEAQMNGVGKKGYKGSLKKIFPELTRLQRAEVKEALVDAGFKLKGNKIKDFKA